MPNIADMNKMFYDLNWVIYSIACTLILSVCTCTCKDDIVKRWVDKIN